MPGNVFRSGQTEPTYVSPDSDAQELPAAATLADATANPSLSAISTYLLGFNGTTWSRVRIDGNSALMTRAVAGSGAGAKTSVNDSASSVTILASNSNRRGAAFFNDSTEALYLDLTGGTASATSFTVKIAAQGYYELDAPFYTGLVTGIWAADASGAVRVTEWT